MKNPGLNDDAGKMTISVASFKRSMEQSYRQGNDDRDSQPPQRVDAAPTREDMFGDMFGGSDDMFKGFGR